MTFYADLHVHSRYSRATSREADLPHLALWARRKGITVVGTGDFTHPAWFDEIRSQLVPAEPGLFRLRPEIEREIDGRLPPSCRGEVRFLLEVEISTIYKKGDRTRKVHHLIYAASLDTAARLRERLGAIGNLAADGRPILGLDSRHLLEITLESGPDAFLIPAHVWTPWFAVLGSKSGFDSVEECYGDLAPHIFAAETGLSSDPPMNRRVSCLDRFTLVSNSDAHSPPMLGREACAFATDLDYFAMRRALETGEGFAGTVEFFPEEGKYHLDGHRACGVRLTPAETRLAGGRCPVCGGSLTVGVMHRVEELADRPEIASGTDAGPAAGTASGCGAGKATDPGPDRRDVPGPRTAPFRCLVPLPEIVAEIRGVGPKSRSVEQDVTQLVGRLGPEIDILEHLPLEEISRAAGGLLPEALSRLRAGKVRRESGYDGEYGVIRLFEPDEIRSRSVVAPLFAGPPLGKGKEGEIDRRSSSQARSPALGDGRGGQGLTSEDGREKLRTGDLFAAPAGADSSPGSCQGPAISTGIPGEATEQAGSSKRPGEGCPDGPVAVLEAAAVASPDGRPDHRTAGPLATTARHPGLLAGLDPDQRAAAAVGEGPLLIVAGPGTGKTRTLTHRLAHLVLERGVPAGECLAITFSRRAAAELEERLAALLPPAAGRPLVSTFHGLGLAILREQAGPAGLAPGFRLAAAAERTEIARDLFALSPAAADRLLEEIGAVRRLRGSDPAAACSAELAPRLAAYEEALAARGLLDFDDLLLKPLALLRARPDLAASYRQRWRWISIDEYQDVDALQYGLVRQLAPAAGNLCAIGDPDQSIYGFRGADVGFFLRFERDYPGARVVHLTRNYRATRTLVDAACSAIRPASLVPDRRLAAVADGPCERIVLQRAASDRAEAELVVHTLERLLGGTSYFALDTGRVGRVGRVSRAGAASRAGRVEEAADGPGLSFADVAILYRTEAQVPPLAEALGRAGIPFQKRSHRPLSEQPGVLALVQVLARESRCRAAAGGADGPSGPGRGERAGGPGNPESAEACLERAVRELTEPELPEPGAGGRSGAPDRTVVAAAAELLRPLATRAGDDLDAFLTEIACGGEVDAWDPRAERVSLLTLHASKGLEFPVVFLVGCEEGLLPLVRPGAGAAEAADLAEERRLFFVGITRARARLFLFHSRRRTLRGQTQEPRPSPFLADLGEEHLERRDEPDLGPRRPEQLRLL